MKIKAWWQTVTTIKTDNLSKLTKIIEQINTFRKNVDSWKREWNDTSLIINQLYADNLQATPNNTIETLERQLKLRNNIINELRAFLDQEEAKNIKFNKRNKELIEELAKQKKKKI